MYISLAFANDSPAHLRAILHIKHLHEPTGHTPHAVTGSTRVTRICHIVTFSYFLFLLVCTVV